MGKVTTDQIKKLRAKTKAGVMDCRQALEASKGDMKKAEKWLLEKGIASAKKREGRKTKHGLVEAYVHHDKSFASLASVACETDFVAGTAEFKELAHDVAMQAGATETESVKELLNQPWIKDESKTIGDLVKEVSAKTGENIVVRGLKRLKLGEEK